MKKMKFSRGVIIMTACFLVCIPHLWAQTAGRPGDVNNDGRIDIVDALMTAQYYVGLNPRNFDLYNADVNYDGQATIVDALVIAQIYVGMLTPPPTAGPTMTPAATPGQPASGLAGFATQNGGTTGGTGGITVNAGNYNDLATAVAGTDMKIVRITGTISGSGMLSIGSNKTIVGSGANTAISGFGFNISGQKNIIIRNLLFTNASDDSINVQEYSTNIWIDHCSFTNGYDGLLDIKRGSSYITVSWNRFYNHEKTCLLGHSDDNATQDVGNLKVTYHHNFFDNTGTRHPRIRFGYVHVYNNYYVGNEYGVASTMEADVLVEGNYFSNVEDPALAGYADSAAGDLVERNNIYSNCTNGAQTRGSVASFPYSYSLDNASNIPSLVSGNAGVGKIQP